MTGDRIGRRLVLRLTNGQGSIVSTAGDHTIKGWGGAGHSSGEVGDEVLLDGGDDSLFGGERDDLLHGGTGRNRPIWRWER